MTRLSVHICYPGEIQKSRTGDPDWEDLSKPPVPVRSAHYGAKDLASVRLAWIQNSVPFLERPASFFPRPRTPSATETGSQCEIETLPSAQGAASTGYTPLKSSRRTPLCASSLKSNPKKPLCCNLPTKVKSGFKIFSTGSRKHAVHQPTQYPRFACCKQRAGFKRSLHQFGSLKARGQPSFA
jgi:hypothetical protein